MVTKCVTNPYHGIHILVVDPFIDLKLILYIILRLQDMEIEYNELNQHLMELFMTAATSTRKAFNFFPRKTNAKNWYMYLF